jgi:AraC family transcriptional regulator
MSAMSAFEVKALLSTDTVAIRHVHCDGTCRHRSAEECASATELVFPQRGTYVRHVGRDQSVADANHVLLFSAQQGYQVSHPVGGGDESLVVTLPAGILGELAPQPLLERGDALTFRRHSLRIDPRAQALAAILRHTLPSGAVEPLEAESLALTLSSRSLGPRTSHAPAATAGRRKLADRVKVLLASDLARRWALTEIAAEIGGSPVYLTQVFRAVEGIPLYRYQLRLRLARALQLIPRVDDLSALAADLGFSSHSHFTSAFRQAYGLAPAAFRDSIRAA